ncbi:hypothetical protein VNO77_27602 [Canavalia gladiata]|uniref:Uncharacterized protein n=1 Tax=Canavalia gladiata TaxID=3824 RepID=A0AAN9KZ55_CANGL
MLFKNGKIPSKVDNLFQVLNVGFIKTKDAGYPRDCNIIGLNSSAEPEPTQGRAVEICPNRASWSSGIFGIGIYIDAQSRFIEGSNLNVFGGE